MQPIALTTTIYYQVNRNHLLVLFVSLPSKGTNNIDNMKRFINTLLVLATTLSLSAQGWPEKYDGVMLQGFYWDSYDDSQWAVLEKQADDLAASFSLVWIPQSGNCGGTSMGYDDLYWFPGNGQYDSSFGTESQLRSMINTFKTKGIGTIADVVINHRRNVSNWVDFPAETYNGVTYQLQSTDICANDDGGATKTWATNNGYSLSANYDTGEGWSGMRDLDHKSENVQTNVKAYLKMLLDDLGYVGFRYDMVKGYSGSFTKTYNEYSNPLFSVGECWDSSNTIKNWIDATGKTSAAFDFQFKYVVRNATDNSNWAKLNQMNDNNWPLISNNFYQAAYNRYAITFVENHDTEVRPDGSSNGPLRKDTLAANAYLLAMPGTPCVFFKHWKAYKPEIKAMIEARKIMGINNESNYNILNAETSYFAVEVTGTKGNLICCVGTKAADYDATSQGYTKALAGYHYAYWMPNSMETAWVNKGSGDFSEAFDVTMTAISASTDAPLVYTTDGSTPSATNGTKVASGSSINISATTTLSVGLLVGSVVKGIVTRTFTYKEPSSDIIIVPEFCKVNEGETCAFFEAPATWTKTICCWAWTDSPSDNFTYSQRKNWPGVDCTFLGYAQNGNAVWKWTWDGTKQKNSSATQPAKIIFSNSGSPQTADLEFKNGGYYNKAGLQKVVTTGIQTIQSDTNKSGKIYSIDGRLINSNGTLQGLSKGLYIVNGKKVVIK